MIVGFVGLGKMCHNMVLNLISKNVKVVIYNRTPEKTRDVTKKGAIPAFSLKDLVFQLPSNKKIVWLMVPHNAVDSIISELRLYMTKGDTIIDGGDSNYKDTIRRARELREKGIRFLDVGTSGGVEGALNGLCLMVGGDRKAYEDLRLLFSSLAAKDGYGYMGQSGAGHFVKMVHNVIEYGTMQAVGEGFEFLKHSEFEIDMKEVAHIWNRGSDIRGRILELTEDILKKDPLLENAEHSFENTEDGKWAVKDALERGVSIPSAVISLMVNYKSKSNDMIAEKIISALRQESRGQSSKLKKREDIKPEVVVSEKAKVNKKVKTKVKPSKKKVKKKSVKPAKKKTTKKKKRR